MSVIVSHEAFRMTRNIALSLMLVLSLTPAAQAGTTQNDVLVVGRALGFLKKPPTGPVEIGIVYAPTNAASAADAAALERILGTGLQVGNITLKPVRVSLDAINTANVNLFFLTEGLGPEGAAVGTASKERKITCVTVDLDQVRNGNCTMGVHAGPKVEILVDRAAAAASDTFFTAVFRMMITEF